MSYGWIIDVDHIADKDTPEDWYENAKGVVGPRDIPGWMEDLLKNRRPGDYGSPTGKPARMYRFRIYDDDGELYYTGRMITDEGATNEACGGPLWDFGQPNAGATEIRYVNHPEMNI